MKGCIESNGALHSAGYRQVVRDGAQVLAHRQAWIDAYGPIPSGLVLHHLCENKVCVNLDHLALVTRAEHPRLHRLTRCKRGHLRTPDNLWGRKCRECQREYQRQRRRAVV